MYAKQLSDFHQPPFHPEPLGSAFQDGGDLWSSCIESPNSPGELTHRGTWTPKNKENKEQEWRSGENTRFAPMWSTSDFRTRQLRTYGGPPPSILRPMPVEPKRRDISFHKETGALNYLKVRIRHCSASYVG